MQSALDEHFVRCYSYSTVPLMHDVQLQQQAHLDHQCCQGHDGSVCLFVLQSSRLMSQQCSQAQHW
jgi:hypothetical protein